MFITESVMTRDVKIKVGWYRSEHRWKRTNLWISAESDWISMRAQHRLIFRHFHLFNFWNPVRYCGICWKSSRQFKKTWLVCCEIVPQHLRYGTSDNFSVQQYHFYSLCTLSTTNETIRNTPLYYHLDCYKKRIPTEYRLFYDVQRLLWHSN